ncbi:MAG: ATP-binding protein [Alphaproteobacteria bacterium]
MRHHARRGDDGGDALSGTGPADRVSTVLDGSRAALAGLGAWIEAATAGHALPPDLQFALRLCVEEAATNAIAHGEPATADPAVAIRIAFRADAVTAEIEDAGGPFDPATAPLPQLGTSLDDTPDGGRGLRLLRSFADSLDYERRNGRNRLIMGFRRR